MDADGTHNPDLIVKFLEKIKFYDIISTNRFLNQNSIKDWPVHRKFLTIIRYKLTKYFLKQEYDSSGAFRCYNLKKIKLSDLLLSKDNRYAFFWQSIFFLDKKKYKIKELSVDLPFRKIGSSKMKLYDIAKSAFQLIYFGFFK